MDIKHIYDILVDNYENLYIVKEGDRNNTNNYIVSNALAVSNSLKQIGNLNVIDSLEIFKEDFPCFYSWSHEYYSAQHTSVIEIESRVSFIKGEVVSLINTLEKIIPLQDGYILTVKLPDYKGLENLPDFYVDLDLTFTPIVKLLGLEDHVEIYSFENGSKLNRFKIKNKTTFKFLVHFMNLSMMFSKEYREHQEHKMKMETMAEELKFTQEQNRNSEERLKKEEENINSKYITEIFEIIEREEITIDRNGQEDQKIKETIKRSYKAYSRLEEEGTEFYADINGEAEKTEDIQELIEGFNSSQKKLNDIKKINFFEKYNTKSLAKPSLEEDNEDIEGE